MKKVVGNVWDVIHEYDVFCIPTNGYVKKSDGKAVMGAGVAKEAKNAIEGIDETLGELLSKNMARHDKDDLSEPWNVPYYLGELECDTHIFSFPVKPTVAIAGGLNEHILERFRSGLRDGWKVQGWQAQAIPELIVRSAEYLVEIVNFKKFESVLVPKPGCGNGGLKWSDIKPLLQDVFDDRFSIIDKR